MPLTDRSIKALKPGAKPRKVSHSGGLFLLVNPNGSRYWRMKYRISGREKTLALGVYPDVTLAAARAGRDDARRVIASGGDPSAVKRAAHAATGLSGRSAGIRFKRPSSPGVGQTAGALRKPLDSLRIIPAVSG